LRATLATLPDDGELRLMVTHFVTISAITNIAVGSGEAVAYDPATGKSVRVDF